MYTFNTALKTALDACTTQKAVTDKLNEMLTGTRTISLIKDGVPFYTAVMSGLLKMERNAITDYGYVIATSLSTAANLATGTCKLRITGNGNYAEATLGLTVAAQTAAGIAQPVIYDFMLGANPVAGSSIAFTRRVKTKLPTKPSGIGPTAPAVPANAPKRFEIYAVVNGVEALVDFLEFDTPDDPLVFADAEIAGQMGETRVIKSSKTIIFDKFQFGAKMYVSSASNAEDGVTPLIRVLAGAKPYNQGWDNYPASRNWPSTTVYMHPPAFRAKLKNSSGAVIYTWQMRDGLPINDPSLSTNWDGRQVVRPPWHCAAMLPWQNVRARVSDLKNKFYSGVTADSIRPSLGKRIHSVNGTDPFLDGYTNLDGYNHMYTMDQWPKNYNDYFAASAGQDQPLDPYAQPMGSNSGHTWNENINGWDWEPGSKSGHEYQTGPGGVRFDRFAIPSLYALWATTPSGNRLKGNVPLRNMMDAHAKAFFNIPMFLWRDVQNFTGIPDNEIVAPGIGCLWNQGNAYYGGTFGKGQDFTVDIKSVSNGVQTNNSHRDVKGKLFWNGWATDYLHGYKQPAWYPLLINDPVYAVAAKAMYNAQAMAQLDEQTNPANDYRYWCNRQFAWRYLNRTMAWKLASGKEAGHDRLELQEQFRIGLESVYDNLYVPAYERPITDAYTAAIRYLGVKTTQQTDGAGGSVLRYEGGSLSFYLADVAILMKQVGLWSILRKLNYKCERALWFLIQGLDKPSIDYFLDTRASWENKYGSGYFEIAYDGPGTQVQVSTVPQTWAEWTTRVYDPYYSAGAGVEDWVTNADGSPAERFAGQHYRGAWVLNRGIYFPEYEHPRAEAGRIKVQAYYDKRKAQAAVPANPVDKMYADFVYLLPAAGARLPPSELGAQ